MVLAAVALTFALLAALALRAWRRPARTAPITDADGRVVPGSVATLERVTLGGVEQALLVRSLDPRNPVLLYLHGGPGTSELGMLRRHNVPALERHFTVVVWDQRGAGRSYAAREPAAGLTVEQLVSDTLELAELLRRRFGQDRIVVVGHSWGSALGALAVARRPDLFHAFVGVGQAVNMAEGERASYAWALAAAERAGDAAGVAALRRIGEPPYPLPLRKALTTQRRILGRHGGEVHGSRSGGMPTFLRALLSTTEYGWPERLDVFRGVFHAMDTLWPQILSLDLERQVPALGVPVFLLEGRHDWEAPSVLAARWFEKLEAPRKELVWFERSAHFVNTEEPEAFHAVLIERVRPVATRVRPSGSVPAC
jgi:pimeloyl-ACP methyl ester carboxylesterase